MSMAPRPSSSRPSSAFCATGAATAAPTCAASPASSTRPYLRVIRLMCSGRVDLEFIFRAFAKKADGVFIGGCHLNDCHYNPEGNYDALGNSLIAKRILENVGVNPGPAAARMGVGRRGHPLRRGHERLLRQDQEPGAVRARPKAIDIAELAGRLEAATRARALHQAGGAREAEGAGEDGRGLPQILRQRRSSTRCSRS